MLIEILIQKPLKRSKKLKTEMMKIPFQMSLQFSQEIEDMVEGNSTSRVSPICQEQTQ